MTEENQENVPNQDSKDKEPEKKDVNVNVSPDSKQERMWAMFCHLSALLALLVWVPFINIIGPLVLWLIKKNEMPLVDEQGKEALNFQISMSIYSLACIPLFLIFIGIVLLWGLAIANVVFVIIASIKINNGEKFKYPYTIRLIK